MYPRNGEIFEDFNLTVTILLLQTYDS